MRLIYWYWGLKFRSNCFETFKYSKNGDFSIILIFLSYSVNHIQWYLVFSNFTDTIADAEFFYSDRDVLGLEFSNANPISQYFISTSNIFSSNNIFSDSLSSQYTIIFFTCKSDFDYLWLY